MSARRPIGWVLECHSKDIGTWYDFKDGPSCPGPDWFPVVPAVDPLLEGMHSVLWCGHSQMWDARAKGCTAWAKATTAYEAVALAALLAAPEQPEEDPLW